MTRFLLVTLVALVSLGGCCGSDYLTEAAPSSADPLAKQAPAGAEASPFAAAALLTH